MEQVPNPNGKTERKSAGRELTLKEACENIFFSDALVDKLQICNVVMPDELTSTSFFATKEGMLPGRPPNLKFSDLKNKFPKDQDFKLASGKAKALHFFANHELLAIEVMAWMILTLPEKDDSSLKYKQEIWKTLQDEQRHLALYQQRLMQLGFQLGDFPVNDYFWKIFSNTKGYTEYFALMGMTFEAANLDFSQFYQKIFRRFDDELSANLMQQIFEDELHHVRLGVHHLKRHLAGHSLWDEYVRHLAWPITPARSKGINYQEVHRRQAGFPEEFIQHLSQFNDNYRITQRSR